MTTREVIELAQEKGTDLNCKCNGCVSDFRLFDMWCAQPDDLAECPKCHSTHVEVLQ